MHIRLFVFLLFVAAQLPAQVTPLPNTWLFTPDDDPAYKNPSFDDHTWTELAVPGYWEDQGFADHDGFSWYRFRFSADKTLQNKELYLLAGKIDDIDETYLNGQLIGQTGRLSPDTFSQFNTQRVYKIPEGLLKSENVVAIRVFDTKYDGGIGGGIIGLSDKKTYTQLLHLGPAPKQSWFKLSTANGLIAAVYDAQQNEVESVFPHIFRDYDLDAPVQPFLKHLRLQTDEKPVSVSFEENTHIIAVVYPKFTVRYFAAFSTDEKVFYAQVEGPTKTLTGLKYTSEGVPGSILLRETVQQERSSGRSCKTFLFSFSDSLHQNEPVLRKAAARLQKTDLVKDELAYMHAVFQRAHFPEKLTAKERALYEQSITTLKMAQVSQSEVLEKARGQVLAALPPGSWNICWLRDGVYSILGLNQAGLFAEAKNALLFHLNADVGYYKKYVHTDGIDYGVKSDYKISVCRYFGNGKEESDFNEQGPNIELDGFGLFLVAFSDYIEKSGDVSFLKKNEMQLRRLVADPILTFIEQDNLIRKESGPWEMHLPGRKQAFTSIVSAAGLQRLVRVLQANSIPTPEKYNATAIRLTEGIKKNLVYENRLIKGFAEAATPATLDFYDGGTIEAFTLGVLDDPTLFATYYKAYEENLRITPQRGFARLNNPDWYTTGEWPFLDMRFAMALHAYGQPRPAKQLLDLLTDYAARNNNQFAELYDRETENYEGSTPMVGYGAGAYIAAMRYYYEK